MSAWTISEACEEFERAGMPVDPDRFRLAVTRAARAPSAGEMPSGDKGGRGRKLYDIGRLQRIHAWLIEQDELNEAGTTPRLTANWARLTAN